MTDLICIVPIIFAVIFAISEEISKTKEDVRTNDRFRQNPEKSGKNP